MDNRNHIDDIIRKGLENYSQKPSSRVWDNIAASGIPDVATSNKNSRLFFKNGVFWFLGSATAIAVFISIFITSEQPIAISYQNADLIFENNFSNIRNTQSSVALEYFSYGKLNTEQNSEPKILSNVSYKLDEVTQNIVSEKSETYDYVPDNFSYVELNTEKNNAILPIEIINPNTSNSESDLSNTTYPEIVHSEFSESELSNNNPLQPVEYILPDLNLVVKGFYLGIAGGYNYTSVIENNPAGWDNTPIESTSKYGSVKSISAGYNFNQYFGVQVGYNVNSSEGTNYALSSSVSKEKTLQLTYEQIPVTFRFLLPQMNYLTNSLHITNVYAGIQYNKLKDFHLPQEQRYESVDNAFKESTISLVAGIDYDIFLSKNIFLSIGARGTYSSEIATEHYPISDNQPHSFTIGGRAALSYKFSAIR